MYRVINGEIIALLKPYDISPPTNIISVDVDSQQEVAAISLTNAPYVVLYQLEE